MTRHSYTITLVCVFTCAPACAQESGEQRNFESAVTYDLSTNTSTIRGAVVSENTPTAHAGTGSLELGSPIGIEELEELAGLESHYAPYEEKEGNKDADGNFVPFSVIEPDTREVVVNTTEQPARTVVQIKFKRSGNPKKLGCTGAMIGPRHVLTAGHCVFSRGHWHTEVIVYPGRNAGVMPFGRCTAVKLYSIDGWVKPKTAEDARLYDIGAIEIDCDVGNITGWLTMQPLGNESRRAESTVYGYPCDKTPTGRQWKGTDRIRSIAKLKVYHRNDTYGCMSGSPVFLGDNSTTIYAVHTNGLHGKGIWSKNNAATRITAERINNLVDWISQ